MQGLSCRQSAMRVVHATQCLTLFWKFRKVAFLESLGEHAGLDGGSLEALGLV